MKNFLKKKLFVYSIFIVILTIFSIFYALLIYNDKINSEAKSFNVWTFIIGLICFFVLGLLAGNTAQKNGLLEGLIAALIVILVSLIINFFVREPFIGKSFVKIISFFTASSLGGVLGVNFKPLYKTKDCVK